MQNRLVERFLNYVQVDTMSNPESETFPSSINQLDLAKIVYQELISLNLQNVLLDENGYVTATIPSNVDHAVPVVGLVAHFDTSPDFTGKSVKPIYHKAYQGGGIVIDEQTQIMESEFPFLRNLIGHDIITTDGTTLLGADNKAGIAEIMELIYVLQESPSINHGEIRILFTPDEEVGRGTEKVNLENFPVEFAYTVDGGEEGELEFENFNAASLKVQVKGRNIHPGSAKDKMKNSILMAMEYHALLPQVQAPQHTDGYEGFYHLNDIEGTVEHTELFYIIRDHDKTKFNEKKQFAENVAGFLNEKYGDKVFTVTISDSYYNMREMIEPVMYIVDYAKEAMEAVGVKPIIKAIRGGTDGARLSFMGVPTPNIFTGGYNFHGRYEMISVNSMNKAVEVLKTLVEIIANKAI